MRCRLFRYALYAAAGGASLPKPNYTSVQSVSHVSIRSRAHHLARPPQGLLGSVAALYQGEGQAPAGRPSQPLHAAAGRPQGHIRASSVCDAHRALQKAVLRPHKVRRYCSAGHILVMHTLPQSAFMPWPSRACGCLDPHLLSCCLQISWVMANGRLDGFPGDLLIVSPA